MSNTGKIYKLIFNLYWYVIIFDIDKRLIANIKLMNFNLMFVNNYYIELTIANCGKRYLSYLFFQNSQ